MRSSRGRPARPSRPARRSCWRRTKSSGDFSAQFAAARVTIRFKKGTNFRQIADLRFGVEFDEGTDVFAWQVTLVPAASYNRIDDLLWHQWRIQQSGLPPGAKHQDKANTVRFLSRPLAAELTAEMAFNDVKSILEFLLGAETALADAVGLDAGGDD